MMKQNLEYFIAERAEHLAIVHLTRSPNLVIERMKTDRDYGLDMLATISRDESPTGRIFGVQVKGQDKALKDGKTPQLILSSQERQYFQELPFPVCFFFFTMEDDKGYYKWIKSPHALNKHLRSAEEEPWHVLSESSIAQMVEEVNSWYDEKSHSAA
jgi:hypothetical protein